MSGVIAYLIANPIVLVAALSLVESAAMPFVPVKYNGVAVTVFGFLKKKITGAK